METPAFQKLKITLQVAEHDFLERHFTQALHEKIIHFPNHQNPLILLIFFFTFAFGLITI